MRFHCSTASRVSLLEYLVWSAGDAAAKGTAAGAAGEGAVGAMTEFMAELPAVTAAVGRMPLPNAKSESTSKSFVAGSNFFATVVVSGSTFDGSKC